MYKVFDGNFNDSISHVLKGSVVDPRKDAAMTGRTILKYGTVVDPKNNIEEVKDVAIMNGEIVEVNDDIQPEKGDKVLNCEGLLIVPGLIDGHLHLGDLFEVGFSPIFEAVQNGVTMGFSPGAGNTFMTPALLGAEMDRGLPLNIGAFIGGPAVLGTMLSVEELILLFKGELDADTAAKKMTQNQFSYMTSPLVMGLKDHMGHYLMPDEKIDAIYEITSATDMMFMTHTQSPEHAVRMVELSKGRGIHLAHMTAAGCGTHGDPVESMKTVIELSKQDHVTGEFVTTMLRDSLGNREGLLMTKESQKLAYDALEDGTIDVINSDGQAAATMKGFGDTRDNIPALIELADKGILSLSDSIATMTSNAAKQWADITKNNWWTEKVGHLGTGALANITVINKEAKRATYTIVNGEMVAFEGRIVRSGNQAGGWMSKHGMVKNVGVGHAPTHTYGG